MEFIDIVKTFDLEKIKEAVESGKYDIDFDEGLALIYVSEEGYIEIVKYLVEQGANIYLSNCEAFNLAAGNGHLEVVKYLIEQGMDIHTGNDTSITLAAENGYLEMIKYLVEQGANIHADDEDALKASIENGHYKIFDYLIKQGANIQKLDNDNFEGAVESNNIEIIQYLIEQIYLNDYETLFKYNVLKQYVEVLQNIMEKKEFKVKYKDEEITFHSLELLSKLSTFFKAMMQSGLLENKFNHHIIKNEEEWNAFKRIFCEFKFEKSDDYWHEYYHVGKYFNHNALI